MSTHPDILLAVQAILNADPDIEAATNGLVFINRLPQGKAGEALANARSLLAWVVTENPWNDLEGAMGIDQALVQVDANGANDGQSRELAWYAWKALSGSLGVFKGVNVLGAARNSGVRSATDRPLGGTDQYRYIASQDFRFTYGSLELVLP